MSELVDLPGQDKALQEESTDFFDSLRAEANNSLYLFNTAIMGYKDLTMECHGPMCVFLDSNPSRFKLVLYPRDHFKTTCGTIGGNLQLACRNSEQRILLANESATNAERMLRAIRQHAESNRIFRTVYSHIIPKDLRKVRWNDSELDFVRQGVYPEPTFDTIGMTGAVTSRHYSHMCFDDPISEEAVKSDKVMQDTVSRLSALLALLTNPNKDTVWFIGTRWAMHDVYAVQMQNFGELMARCVRAAIEEGHPIFPERFSLETLGLMQRQMGDYKFSCLMMNNPRDESLQDFNTADLRWWAWSGEHVVLYALNGTEHRRLRLDQLDISVAVDLAPAEKITSDRNAVTVTGVTPWGEAVVLEAWGARCTPLELIEKLFQVKQRFSPRVFGIEGVAYQKAFKYFLKAEAERRGLWLNVAELKALGRKESRIRGLQPVAATGRLYLHPSQALLRQELAEFPLGQHDDVIDSLSMHLQLWRGVLSPEQLESYARRRNALIARIDGYGLHGDPGFKVLPSGALLRNEDEEDFDYDEVRESRRWQNWEEREMS